jgi:hypothetical protein
MEQLRAICRCPIPNSNLSLRTSLIFRMDNLLVGKLILPFGGGLLAILLSSATRPETGRNIPQKPISVPPPIEK